MFTNATESTQRLFRPAPTAARADHWTTERMERAAKADAAQTGQ